AQSDARNAAIALESYLNDEFAYPLSVEGTFTTDQALGNDETIVVSEEVTMEVDFNADEDRYLICTGHSNLDPTYVAVYDSGAGGLDPTFDRGNPAGTGDCDF
ncbi:MAG: hypothetical protein WD942_09595, partial [Dehalococcoidia bacterium]